MKLVFNLGLLYLLDAWGTYARGPKHDFFNDMDRGLKTLGFKPDINNELFSILRATEIKRFILNTRKQL